MGTCRLADHYEGMSHFRYVTPHRAGKWYPDLLTAQRHAFAIGAGFLDQRTGMFYPYKDTRLEQRLAHGAPGFDDDPQGIAA